MCKRPDNMRKEKNKCIRLWPFGKMMKLGDLKRFKELCEKEREIISKLEQFDVKPPAEEV